MKIIRSVLAAGTICLGAGVLYFLSRAFQSSDQRDVSFDVDSEGRTVVFSAANGNLYLLDVASSTVHQLTDTPGVWETSPTFSPNGRYVVFSGRPSGKDGSALYLLSLEDDRIRQLTDGAFWDASPAFSANEKTIAFARGYRHRPYSMGGWTWDHYDACTIDLDGQGLRRITQREFYEMSGPIFCPEDDSLLFSAVASQTEKTLYSVSISQNGGQPVPLPGFSPPVGWKGGAWASEPHTTEQGKKTAFVSDRALPYSYDVCVMEGTDARTVQSVGALTAGSYNQQPRLTSKGGALFFLAGDWKRSSPRYSLWWVNCDGSDLTKIADSSLFARPMAWKPC